MPEREFIADACSKHNSRSSPALVTIWGSIDMLIGSRKLWLADHSYSYLALEQFNRRLSSVWSWLSRHCFHLPLLPIYHFMNATSIGRFALNPCHAISGLFLTVTDVTGAKLALLIRMETIWLAPTSSMNYSNGVSR